MSQARAAGGHRGPASPRDPGAASCRAIVLLHVVVPVGDLTGICGGLRDGYIA